MMTFPDLAFVMAYSTAAVVASDDDLPRSGYVSRHIHVQRLHTIQQHDDQSKQRHNDSKRALLLKRRDTEKIAKNCFFMSVVKGVDDCRAQSSSPVKQQ